MRSAPTDVSMTNGTKRRLLGWSKYSSFFPEYSWWRPRSKSPRLMHALDLLEAQRSAEIELDVERCPRVVRQFGRPCAGGTAAASRRRPSARCQSMRRSFQYSNHCMSVAGGVHEELHLHLLEFARAEDEVPGGDLVAERLADLGDAERHLLPRRLLDVEEVHIDALRRLRPQVHHRRAVLHRPHERLEHEVEHAAPPSACPSCRRPGTGCRACRAYP